MDVKAINPFLDAFKEVMPVFGFTSIQKTGLDLVKKIDAFDTLVTLGIVGDIEGNVIYSMDSKVAMSIASKMMMGAPVNSFDEMAQSAISELSNMLTAKASIYLYKNGIKTNISTPTLLFGPDINISTGNSNILKVTLDIDSLAVIIFIALKS